MNTISVFGFVAFNFFLGLFCGDNVEVKRVVILLSGMRL